MSTQICVALCIVCSATAITVNAQETFRADDHAPIGVMADHYHEAGEVMFVPHSWGHATRNLEPSIGWATEFSFDRRFSVEFDEDEERQGGGGGAAAGWEDGGELPSADDVVIRSPRGGDDMERDAQRDEL